MICDIIVRGAPFEVGVQATRELLFDNEIYPLGHQQRLEERANFLLQDCDVHSHEGAVEWVRMNAMRLQSQVADTMRPVLTPMGWQILWVNPGPGGGVGVFLEEANGPGRGDQSLIQVSKV